MIIFLTYDIEIFYLLSVSSFIFDILGLIIFLPSLFHAGWSCIRLDDRPSIKLLEFFKLVVAGLSLVCCLVILVSTGGFLLLRYFSGVYHTLGI